MTDDMCAVGINGVTKRFGDSALAVDDLDLQIREGEFFSLLGPVRLRQDHARCG